MGLGLRFRDVRLTVIKGAVYPPGHELPEIELPDGMPEPTPRRLSRFIGKSAVVRKRALPLEFATPVPNRADRRRGKKGRQRPGRLTDIHLPWKDNPIGQG